MASKKVSVDIDQAARVNHDVDVNPSGTTGGPAPGDKTKVKESSQTYTDANGGQHTVYEARITSKETGYIDRDGDGEAETKLVVKAKENHEVTIDKTAVATVTVEGSNPQGAVVDVHQQATVDQDAWLDVDAHGNKNKVMVKVNATETTDIDLDTQVDVTLTRDRVFDADLDQDIDLDQDVWVDMDLRRVEGVDFDADVDQSARVIQDADIGIKAKGGNLQVTVDPDQLAIAGQDMDLDITPAEYLDG